MWSQMMYAQGWALVYYLNHGESGKYQKDFVEYMKLELDGQVRHGAFKEVFGKYGIDKIEKGYDGLPRLRHARSTRRRRSSAARSWTSGRSVRLQDRERRVGRRSASTRNAGDTRLCGRDAPSCDTPVSRAHSKGDEPSSNDGGPLRGLTVAVASGCSWRRTHSSLRGRLAARWRVTRTRCRGSRSKRGGLRRCAHSPRSVRTLALTQRVRRLTTAALEATSRSSALRPQPPERARRSRGRRGCRR